MHDDYGDEVLLVSVALDEESKAVKSVLSEYPSDWVQVHEPRSGFNGQLAKAFRVSAIPAFCVIGADGRMLGVNMDLDEARELLAGLVNQQRESDAGFAKH